LKIFLEKLEKYFKGMKPLILLLSLFFTGAVLSNPVNEVPFKKEGDLFNFYIEIPAGTKEKWEINKSSGLLELEQKNNQARIVSFLAYPGNYGFIPQTISGDGDPIDLIDLDESSPQGTVKQVKIIGAIYFKDRGEPDYKYIAVSPSGTFNGVNTIEELLLYKPSVAEIIKLWFLSYKESGKMNFIRFIDLDESMDILRVSHERWRTEQNETN